MLAGYILTRNLFNVIIIKGANSLILFKTGGEDG